MLGEPRGRRGARARFRVDAGAYPSPDSEPRAAWRRAARLQIMRLHDLSVPVVPDAGERE
jgi:hypothetical protein